MTDRPTSRFYAALDHDARLTAAIERLPVAHAGERPSAERAVRAAALFAAGRTLGGMLRDLWSWLHGARTPRPAAPAAPGV